MLFEASAIFGKVDAHDFALGGARLSRARTIHDPLISFRFPDPVRDMGTFH